MAVAPAPMIVGAQAQLTRRTDSKSTYPSRRRVQPAITSDAGRKRLDRRVLHSIRHHCSVVWGTCRCRHRDGHRLELLKLAGRQSSTRRLGRRRAFGSAFDLFNNAGLAGPPRGADGRKPLPISPAGTKQIRIAVKMNAAKALGSTSLPVCSAAPTR
jgi:hypothetical protein